MAEKIQLEVEIKGGESVASASNKVKSLKTELKEMKALLASGTLGAKEFEILSQKAGQLEDRIGDVNKQVKNLASDTRTLDGFIDIASGIAGGFAAAQGAIALFGSENEDLQKTLVKVQGAVALLSGVQAIANALQKESAAMTTLQIIKTKAQAVAQRFLTATTLETTAATYALRAALIASGIGAIVVLLGAAAGAMGMFTSSTEDNKEATDKLTKSHQDLKQALDDEANAISRLDALNLEKSKQRGDALSTQIKIEQEALQNRLYAGQQEIKRILSVRDSYKEQSDDYNKYESERVAQAQKNLDLLNEIELSKIRYQGALQKESVDNAKKAEDKKTSNQIDSTERSKEKQLEIEKERLRLLNELNKQRDDVEKESLLRTLSIKDREIAELQLGYTEKLQLFTNDAETTKLLTEQMNQDIAAINKKYRDEQSEIDKENKLKEEEDRKKQSDLDKAAYEQRFAIASSGLQALSDLTTAFAGKSEQSQRRAFNINKALNISTTLIDTYMSAQKAYASQLTILTPDAPIRANVAAGVAVASGLARVAAITKTQFGGGSGGFNSGNQTMSNQPNIQGYTTNNVPNQQRGQSGNMRVYVTETDIRNSSRKVDGIYSQATVE